MTTEVSLVRPAVPTLRTVVSAFALSAGLALVASAVLQATWPRLFDISSQFQPLTMGPQFATTLAAALGGALTLALLIRWTQRPMRTFVLIAGVVFALSFIPVWAYAVAVPPNPGVGTGEIIALCITHVTALVCIVPVQMRVLRPAGDARGR